MEETVNGTAQVWLAEVTLVSGRAGRPHALSWGQAPFCPCGEQDGKQAPGEGPARRTPWQSEAG